MRRACWPPCDYIIYKDEKFLNDAGISIENKWIKSDDGLIKQSVFDIFEKENTEDWVKHDSQLSIGEALEQIWFYRIEDEKALEVLNYYGKETLLDFLMEIFNKGLLKKYLGLDD
jgi:hypothetical protein